jgi:restriction endonuclease S subunit
MELKKYKLGEIADFNKENIGSTDKFTVIEYLDTSSITENVISGISFLNISDAPSRAQRKVTNNTIIYSTVRPRLKHYGILFSPKNNLIVSTGFVTIDVKDIFKDKIDARYLFLLLTQANITEYIGNIADTAVSAYPSINPTDISSIYFNFPDIQIQKIISDIWFNYDSKIELNRAINQNLEAMAKQLYDYWFVQFDFPDENGRPYKSSGGKMVWNEKLKRDIPISWETKLIDDVAEIYNGATPSTINELNYGGDIVWITPKDLSDQKQKFVYKGERNISQVGYDSCSTHLLPSNTILMSSRAPIGLLAIAKTELCTNQGFKSFVPKSGNTAIYLYYYLQHHIRQVEQLGTGTTFKEVSREDILKFPILKPSDNVLDLWEEMVSPLNDRQLEIQKENESLTKQRNELLPHLMNGQISVNSDLSDD